MNLLPPPGKGQVLALCLLFIAGTLVYFVGFSAFFRERAEINEEIGSLLETEQYARAKLAQKPRLEQRLGEVAQFEAANTYFLAEDSFDLAAAGLNSKLKQVIGEQANQERCSVISSQNQRAPGNEPYERVTIQVRLRCDLPDLAKVVYQLENATPLLFISELNLYQQPIFDGGGVPQANLGNMDARFDLSGYIRKQAAAP